MELLDVYNLDRQKTGRTIERGSPLAAGEYHLVVHVCFFNSEGKMLIQHRQPTKKNWPDMWDVSVGGCAVTGECSALAAQREVFEEIGVKIDLRGLLPHLTVNFETGFDDFYLVNHDLQISQLKLQTQEVRQVRWAAKEEILDMIYSKRFIPFHPNLIGLLFDMRGNRSGFMVL